MDEACRYIKDGRLAQLRLALLLLDNAAEIQMERCVRSCLVGEAMQEHLRSRVLQTPQEGLPEDLQDLVEWQPLSPKRKRLLDRNFDEKVSFLSERAKQLDTRLAGPLSYLHTYRNEAYHRAAIREATIETAAKLLLDINCELLLGLAPSEISYASDEDHSWLEHFFGKDLPTIFHDDARVSSAVEHFRADVGVNEELIGQLLANHLHSRIQDVFDALDSVVENTKFPDREAAIRNSHSLAEARRAKTGASRRNRGDVEARHSLEFLGELIARLPEIEEVSDRFEAFRRFSVLESELEPVEKNVHELDGEVEAMIQLQSDIARGK